jgi:magnesium chelatase subunit D
MTAPYFPFSAIVGQEKLKEALILNAINPAIGGVLIFGEKGTAKSTAVRGLKNILGLISSNKEVPLIELPLSTTEEMIVGTINIPNTLKSEQIQIEYGLLHKANGGIIYIDEVNLLEDHLVDVILDAAAMGVNRIEREGISHEHPANFILIGTMNPEEGELRPQLLDRFGISAKIKTETEVPIRKEIVCRRLEWEEEKQGFADNWRPEENSIGESIEKARQLLPKVSLSEKYLELAISLALQAKVEGHRVDIIICKTAKTLAALSGRKEVNEKDIYRAAEYALNHRTDSLPTPPSNESPEDPTENEAQNETPSPQSGSQSQSFQTEQPPATQNFETLDIITNAAQNNVSGKTIDPKHKVLRGKVIGAVDSNINTANQSEIAFFPTLIKSIRRGKKKLSEIDTSDLRFKRRISGRKELHVLVIDTSASMGTSQRLSYAKGLMQRILKNDYQKKNYVAVVGTQGDKANVVLKPTRNFLQIDQVMSSIKAKGRTPLLHAIDSALNLVESFHRQNKFLTNLLVVISDGKMNVPFRNSITEDLQWLGKRIKKLDLNNFIVDSNQKYNRSFLLQKMVNIFDGRYMAMEDTLLLGKISL